MIKPISISLSPNTEKDDVFLALKLLFQPWRWKRGEAVERLEKEFKDYLGVKYAFSFNSGRSSLMAVFNSLDLEKNSEILLQAFTCNAVPNPILWLDLKPIYVDCDENTFNIDIEDLKKKIGPKSKAVIVQHTFGLPANLDEVIKICDQNNLVLIEDCAHALGATYNGKKLGTLSKAAFFSFSRDKIISSVYGGIAVTNNDILAQRIKEFQKKISYPSFFWVFQQLLHPVLMNYLILPTYRIFGKYLLIIFQWLQILSKAVHWKEKRGEKPSYFPKRLPNALAILAQNQFKKLEKLNNHRKKIAAFYKEELLSTEYKLPNTLEGSVFLRLPIRHPKSRQIVKDAWRNNILIGDWYDKVIAPHDTKLEKMKYEIGSCPKAEKLVKETFNLPTHINISEIEARAILSFLKRYGN
mgnify:FL=1